VKIQRGKSKGVETKGIIEMERPKFPIMRKTEARLLNTLANPENYALSVAELCRKANISKPTYYRLLRRPSFISKMKEVIHGLIGSSVIPIIHKVTDQAKQGSFPHQRIIFEMVELYSSLMKVDMDLNIKPFYTYEKILPRLIELKEKGLLKSYTGKDGLKYIDFEMPDEEAEQK